MRRATITVLTALVALSPLAVSTAPASAESVTVPDAVDDVVDGRFRPAGEAGGDDEYDRDLADIRSTTLDHQTEQAVLRLTMAEVRNRGRRELTVWGRLADQDGRTWVVTLVRQGRDKTLTLTDEASGDLVDCPGLVGGTNPASATIRTAVPRSCLGDPESLRFGAGVRISWPSPVNSYDDARRTGGIRPDRAWVIKLGRREVRPGAAG